jgi:hypothetical protein
MKEMKEEKIGGDGDKEEDGYEKENTLWSCKVLVLSVSVVLCFIIISTGAFLFERVQPVQAYCSLNYVTFYSTLKQRRDSVFNFEISWPKSIWSLNIQAQIARHLCYSVTAWRFKIFSHKNRIMECQLVVARSYS